MNQEIALPTGTRLILSPRPVTEFHSPGMILTVLSATGITFRETFTLADANEFHEKLTLALEEACAHTTEGVL